MIRTRSYTSVVALLVGLTLCLAVSAYAAQAPSGSRVRAVAPISAAQLDAYLASKGSPMTGQGPALIASGGRWQVDPRLIVAIAGAESSFGQVTCAPFNGWGWGCPNGPYEFESWADGIDTVMRGLRIGYLAEGRTSVALIHQKYAPVGADNDPTGLNNNWTINVSRFIIELGGDPGNVDLDGVGGTISLGPASGASLVDDFDFAEKADEAVAAMTVAPGTPRPLVVRVRNTGSTAWRTQDVRLRRIDLEPRVVGAPYGALTTADGVKPDQVATFVVQLASAGSRGGSATTSWRLEGPAGPFGAEILRPVNIAVPAFVASSDDVTVQAALVEEDAAPGPTAWNVIVRVRNDGSETWLRDGEHGVLLGLSSSSGALAPAGWVNERVPARMLQRSAAPGEEASFAFRVVGETGALAVRPFRAAGWAAGASSIVEIGAPDAAAIDTLRERDAASRGDE